MEPAVPTPRPSERAPNQRATPLARAGLPCGSRPTRLQCRSRLPSAMRDGSGLFNWDLSLLRRFSVSPLGENAALTFRQQSFDFTSTRHFNNPNGEAANRNFGCVQSASNDQRRFQFGLPLGF